MSAEARGRPRATAVDEKVRHATLALLEEHGYAGLRMQDVAATAGVGLGAVYRRWPGKRELVMAALRAGAGQHSQRLTDDPVADLAAALSRISAAVDQGLGKLVAACLSEPDSELAQVAAEAKLRPMNAAIAALLRRVTGPVPDAEERAAIGPAYILWHTATYGSPPGEAFIRDQLLPLMGITIPAR
jgi:AcrR family transcriptional regulator